MSYSHGVGKGDSQHQPLLIGEDEDSSKLGVVRARFISRERMSFDDLISGHSSMRVLTYSNSVSLVSRAAEKVERLEVVFGREEIIGGMNAYFQFQEQLVKEIRDEARGKDVLERKISSEDVKLFVVKEMVNHEKLFLLEGERGRRVITGSANFSERAYSGTQNESYICFD
ncbi:MAG: phospholipase D family protein, partial [Rubrobacteraceae bacterium]